VLRFAAAAGDNAAVGVHAFRGGRILSMSPDVGEPEVLVVDADRIVAAGEDALLTRWPQATVIDLAGRTLLPGLIDAHHHVSLSALHARWADLAVVDDVEGLGAALRAQARREPEAEWIRGAGWEKYGDWPAPVTRRDLDALGLNRPIMVEHFSIHQGLVSSRGLEQLGIGRHTPDPVGGEIVRDSAGEPTGLLRETAWSVAHARSLVSYADPDRWGEHVAARLRTLHAEGVTCIHDAACSPAAEAMYRSLADRGELPSSVLVMPHPAELLSGLDTARLDGPTTGEGNEWLRIGPVKLFADGGVEPLIDARRDGAPFRSGYPFPPINGDVAAAVDRGFHVAVHAIGNAGLQRVVEAFEAVPSRRPEREHRFRVEHACLASHDQVQALAALGAVAVVQPSFVEMLGSRVGHVRFTDATWLPYADLADAGVPLAASSDDPCAPCRPLADSTLGVTRTLSSGAVFGADQGLSYGDWLRAWTAGAAYAGGQEHERGSLTPGKRADLVLVDGPLDGATAPRISETWIAGRRVYP
jgi:predicted amidohydrolase YtcJ